MRELWPERLLQVAHRVAELVSTSGFTDLFNMARRARDPFCGSGTACLAALKTSRNFVGFDIDPRYVELSRRRIRELQLESNTSS